MHILLYEDEHFIRRALAEHLSSQAHEVSEVSTGAECVAFVTHTLPDLILLNGHDIVDKIRALKIEVPIIIMSKPGDKFPAMSKHEHILQKPYELADVSALIQAEFGQLG